MNREFSAGGVVYKAVKEKGTVKTYWLVTKSTPSELYPEGIWRLPKGWLDDEGKMPGPLARGDKKASEEDLHKAALREVREEGGVKASIVKKLETQRFFYTKDSERVLKFVTYYLMEWEKDLAEGPGFETEKVAWLPYRQARKKLKHSGEKKILDKVEKNIEAGLQDILI